MSTTTVMENAGFASVYAVQHASAGLGVEEGRRAGWGRRVLSAIAVVGAVALGGTSLIPAPEAHAAGVSTGNYEVVQASNVVTTSAPLKE